MRIVAICSVLFCLCFHGLASGGEEAKSKEGQANEVLSTPSESGGVKKGPATEEKKKDIWRNFSVGVGVFTLSKNEIVSATIENGYVRVTEERAMRAGPWLQAHWVNDRTGSQWVKPGFFIGAEVLGGDQLVRSVGIGGLLQFRTDQENKNPINLGLGVHWTTIQVLGDGLTENEKVEPGIESIRFKKETHPGVVINVSMDI